MDGSPLLFEVELSNGSSVLIPNSQLRDKAPLLLLDFYEARIVLSPSGTSAVKEYP